ncbi:oxygen-dependent tRNA uridine(34) hydroxylase TrhO [Demequina aurantiaca]|uniref:oxygen-dependent tRNA uridine(34) hydroxylase TrhO n=1 Tax=Demequina aurantiaca TaxID=676200 RepID=UPI000781CCA6|nr:rhodanese-related sulfurtransferase [Demequina aurantiaca]
MAVPKVLLYYVFTPLSDPDAVRLWQRDLCESLGLGGRIILSKDGMNGTVGGDIDAVKKYLRKTREYPAFKNMDVKWSDGNGDDFPRLSVRVRDELVSFGAPGELKVDADGVIGGGKHLSPAALHELVAEREVSFFDGRNAVEAEIGRFRDAVVPDVATTRDFVAELDSGKYDHLKDTPVVTYCTGGIRCEVLSSLMINRGFSEVYQLDGGIARYGEEFKDSGLWEGSLYVFDGREAVTFSDAAAVISSCRSCGAPSARLQNCCDSACREQFVICTTCAADQHFCADHAVASNA